MRAESRAVAPTLFVLAVVVGCYADPPPPVDPSMLPACSAGSYGVLGTDPCANDEDCATCASSSGTTRAVGRSALGPECEAAATAAVACCEGRCTLIATGAMF